jgi:hypothetical protein
MPQPFFKSYSLYTHLQVENGSTVLISGAMPSRDRKRLFYAFLTVRLVDAKGKTIEPYYQTPL